MYSAPHRKFDAHFQVFEAQNEIYVQLFQTPDEAEEAVDCLHGRCDAPEYCRQEDNIRKLRRVAEGEVSEADKDRG